MKRILGNHLVITRGAFIGVVLSWAAILAICVWLIIDASDLSQQRDETQKLAVRNCHAEKVVREVVEAMLFNQAGLDPHLVTLLGRELEDLPRRCP